MLRKMHFGQFLRGKNFVKILMLSFMLSKTCYSCYSFYDNLHDILLMLISPLVKQKVTFRCKILNYKNKIANTPSTHIQSKIVIVL